MPSRIDMHRRIIRPSLTIICMLFAAFPMTLSGSAADTADAGADEWLESLTYMTNITTPGLALSIEIETLHQEGCYIMTGAVGRLDTSGVIAIHSTSADDAAPQVHFASSSFELIKVRASSFRAPHVFETVYDHDEGAYAGYIIWSNSQEATTFRSTTMGLGPDARAFASLSDADPGFIPATFLVHIECKCHDRFRVTDLQWGTNVTRLGFADGWNAGQGVGVAAHSEEATVGERSLTVEFPQEHVLGRAFARTGEGASVRFDQEHAGAMETIEIGSEVEAWASDAPGGTHTFSLQGSSIGTGPGGFLVAAYGGVDRLDAFDSIA